MINFKNKLLITLATFGLILSFSPSLAYAQCPGNTTAQQIKCGANAGAGEQGNPKSLDQTIARILNIFSVIIGVVAVIMIMIGGLRYITSGGASDRVAGAKNTILYAVIGLIVVALAQVIVRFVLNTATNTTPPSGSGGSSAKGVCTTTPYGYYWKGGPNDGDRCEP